MTTTLERDFSRASRGAGDGAAGDFDEERSIRGALRITLLFVAVVLLLLWAGVADAAGAASVPVESGGAPPSARP
jgi:hypothetical protein